MAKKREPELLVDSHHGIYVPQYFAQAYDMRAWHVKPEDEKILLAGPDHEWYWDTCDDVERYAWAYPVKGSRKKYTLYQDGDLWAIPEGFDFEAAGWV